VRKVAVLVKQEEQENPVSLFDLTGKVAIVTGGNGGIGLGMAIGLRDAGARIAIVGRNATKAASALTALGANAIFIAADVTVKADCVAMVERTVAAFGRLDILVNNAGTTVRKQPQDLSEAEWHHVMDTNLTSAFLCSQAAYPAMKAAGGGKIINIGSVMSVFGAPFGSAYGSSKGAVVTLAKSLATAWAPDNIQVNTVLPGWINTDLTAAARAQVAGLNEQVLARTPAARWGEPSDLAGIAVFLASRASDFVTGAAIPVDGGFFSRG
jgi:2-dehydro-3-deoxy-D-gluconate 5-dehydrogenase